MMDDLKRVFYPIGIHVGDFKEGYVIYQWKEKKCSIQVNSIVVIKELLLFVITFFN